MDRILDLQRLEAEYGQADETDTNYSSASNRGCLAANADGFDE